MERVNFFFILPDGPMDVHQTIETFNQKFVDIVQAREVFDLQTGDRMSYPEFKALFRHKQCVSGKRSTRVKAATDVWLDSEEHRRYFRYTYRPGEELFVDETVNLWRDLAASPHPGDIALWTALEDHVFCDLSDEEKHWVRCWMAYPLQNPGTKLHTALLIYSAVQGIGKGLITDTLKLLYGIHRTDSFSNAATIGNRQLQSDFNGWIARRQLIVCDEISVSAKEREIVGERLKSMITERTVTVNEKYKREVDFPNFANFIITTNSPAAIKIEDGDRRFFVISSSAQQLDPEFARRFVSWRDAEPDPGDEHAQAPGLNAVMHHLLTYDTRGFNPYAPALITSGKTEVIENSSAAHETWLRDLKTRFGDYPDLITVAELYEEYAVTHDDRFVTQSAFSTAMTREGFIQASKNAIPVDGGARHVRLRVLKNHDVYARMSDADKGRAYDKWRATRGAARYRPVEAQFVQ